MYILKNAIANLRRNIGRNLILLLIMFALISAAAVSVIIHTSASQMLSQYKKQFESEVIITRDDSKLPKDSSEFIIPGKQMLEKLSTSKYLKSTVKTMTSAMILEGVTTLNQGKVPGKNSGVIVDNDGAPSETDPNYKSPNAVILATTSPDISNEFKQGLRKIVDGSLYKNKNEGIISKQLAEANNIKVGDFLRIKGSPLDPFVKNDAAQTIKVTGIYEDLVPQDDAQIALSTRANEIFISYSSTEGSKIFEDGIALYDMQFTLQNPDDLPALEKDFRKAGLPDYYKVTVNDTAYRKVSGPLQNMAKITKSFTIGIMLLGAVLLTILSILSIRERKYEVGVLRAIGMRKHQVIRNFLYESLLITGCSLLLGLGSAAFISKPVASFVLNDQKAAAVDERLPYSETGLQISSAKIHDVSEVHTALSSQAVLQILTISLLLGLVASTSSIIFITRFEPLKILSERN